MRVLRSLLVIFVFQFFCLSVIADKASINVGLAVWDHETSGHVNYQGTDADLETGFLLEDKTEGFFWIKIEHPVPGLPNVGLMCTEMSAKGSGSINSSFTFGGTTYSASDNVETTLQLDHTDLIFYYELVDIKKNHFDLGILFRQIDGVARAVNNTSSTTQEVDFDGIIPMIYANLELNIPTTGFYVGMEGAAIGAGDNYLSDLRVKAGYRSKARFGIEVGYRRQELELDDLDSFNSNLTFEGVYLALTLKL